MAGPRPEEGPLRPALATRAGRFGLWAACAVAALRAAGLVLVAEAVAGGIVAAMDGRDVRASVFLGLAGAVCQALAAWAGQSVGARSSVGAKTHLRRRFALRLFAGSGRDLPGADGALALTATRSLDEIDDYFTAVVPALTAAAVVPLLVGARILLADWVSAVVIVLTVPLVPVFMILIGQHTAERIGEAQSALDRFSSHLVELARGVPVLVGLGRLGAQTKALQEVSRRYRDTTLATLRTAFLSALALELIATISVAVVAVFVGVRLVHGTMELEDGLLALVLAPECYLPLRRLGAAFHSTENGLAAFDRVRALADRPAAPGPVTAPEGCLVRVADLRVRYDGRAEPVLRQVSLELGAQCPGARLGAHGLLALTGASGAGKSTLLGVLAGLVRNEDGTEVTGTVETAVPAGSAGAAAYGPQRPAFAAASVEDEIALRLPAALREDPGARRRAVEECLEFACLDGEELPGDAAALREMPCEALSPGQQRRLVLARVRASVLAGCGLVLLDEPTAHLDAVTAARVRERIRGLADSVLVVAATHDPALTALGDAHGHLEEGRLRTAAAVPRRAGGVPAAGAPPAETPPPAGVSSGTAAAAPPMRTERTAPAVRLPAVLRRLVRAVNPFAPRFLLALLAGAASVAAGAALTGVSAWLIVRASAQPPIMYLLVAIVGVRFFGLSRAVLAYVQRLWLHDAVLTALTRLRVRLWLGLARRGTADRRVSRGEGALRSLIADVDDVRDLVPRVVMPPLIAVLVSAAAVWALFAVHEAAGWVALTAVLTALGPASAVVLLADRRASAARVPARADVLARVTALLGAREDLLPDGSWRAAAEGFARADARASDHERRSLAARGAGEALATAAMIAASAVMVGVLAPAVAAGELSGELLAVAVLLPMGLVDALLDSLRAVQQWPALRCVLAGLDDGDLAGTGLEGMGASGAVGPARIESLAVEDLSATWPGASAPVFSGLTARFPVPGRTAVTGPSGSGKTTLVSALMRFLDPSAGRVEVNGADAASLRPEDLAARIAWCPQEAHVFDSTLRGNLLIARDREDAPTEEELASALRRAGLGRLLEEAGLDARVGAGGAHLSGGQRQRLAVARTLLVGAEVVILDEPTAHLDPPTARAVMDDLDAALATSCTVLVTHDEALVREGDVRVRL
ncbi:thiol reductant ABC exporter subunit CydC [Brevibacterium album]|uniref:thiol reductant ABC exporter subunit CydC n=1 Tax=Brevibacterium album TaxID=417948 RepID=UPI00040593E0|nr:thiol reductant ABC exporter subunit CydC [Brevibacterium album]